MIVRCGDRSLHKVWLAGPDRQFDIFVSYYGDQPDRYAGDAEYFESRKGPKWSAIGDLLCQRKDLREYYQAFWFPDDDLSATTETINKMFDLFHAFQLSLAQPALTTDSFFSWKITLQDRRYYLRHVNFVEVMAPIFDRSSMESCRSTFNANQTGWGLDHLWPHLCGRGRRDSLAIIDATPVRHTRALGGELYRNLGDINPKDDMASLMEKYGASEIQPTMLSGVHMVERTVWLRTRREFSRVSKRIKLWLKE